MLENKWKHTQKCQEALSEHKKCPLLEKADHWHPEHRHTTSPTQDSGVSDCHLSQHHPPQESQNIQWQRLGLSPLDGLLFFSA